jgi:phosphatidylserine/phosphatidylglycerophosphate/cardiolipin synthase-like enzyme
MMQIYFTDIKSVILNKLQSAHKEILVAVSWLTDRQIYDLLISKINAGIKVSIITRNDYLNNHEAALDWGGLINAGGELRFCMPGKMLHYKFAVIDRLEVMVTSYNWTCFAGRNNRENIIVMQDADAVKEYLDEFGYLSTQFAKESAPTRIDAESINPKLKGFYELTIEDDAKNQSILKL